jgi:hypothetical protein
MSYLLDFSHALRVPSTPERSRPHHYAVINSHLGALLSGLVVSPFVVGKLKVAAWEMAEKRL